MEASSRLLNKNPGDAANRLHKERIVENELALAEVGGAATSLSLAEPSMP